MGHVKLHITRRLKNVAVNPVNSFGKIYTWVMSKHATLKLPVVSAIHLVQFRMTIRCLQSLHEGQSGQGMSAVQVPPEHQSHGCPEADPL